MGEELLQTVRTLAVPRGSATPEEREAGEYVARLMRESGLEVEFETFRAPRTFSWTYFLLYLIPALATALAMRHAWGGVLVAAAGLVMFWLELNFREVLGRLLPRGPSANVLARLHPTGTAARRVVFLAHLDSSKAALNFSPGMVGSFRLSFLIMAGSYFLSSLLLAAHALTGARLAWWLAALPAGYLLVSCGFLLHREAWNRLTPGANDNASGVAVLVALAKAMARERPRNLETWFVATGAEESGTWGVADLLARHRRELQEALFVNIDNVGAGRVHYMTAEGMLPAYRAARELVDACDAVAARRPDLGVGKSTYRLMPTDATRVLAWGYRAVSLLATDSRGRLPNWHWPTDTWENVSPDTLQTCYEFAFELAHELDRHAGAAAR